MNQRTLENYGNKIEVLAKSVRALFENCPVASLLPDKWEQIIKDIKKPQYVLSVVGVVKAGKSTLLNALIFHKYVLPIDVVECTAAISTIQGGRSDMAHMVYMSREETKQALKDIEVKLTDNEKEFVFTKRELETESNIIKEALSRYEKETATKDFPLDQLGLCLAKDLPESDQPVLRSRLVKEAIIETRNSLVGENIRFVDTPGIHSPVRSRVEITISKMRNSDCVILLVPPKGIDQATIDFLKDILPKCPAGKIFAIIGKCDFLAQDLLEFDADQLAVSIKNQVNELQNNLSNLLSQVNLDFRAIKVIPVAPKLALDGTHLNPGSNLDSLHIQLVNFLESSKGKMELESSCQRLSALLRVSELSAVRQQNKFTREAAMLDQTVSEVEEHLVKIKAAIREITMRGEIFKSQYQAMVDTWEPIFKDIPRSVITGVKSYVGSCFAEARSHIKAMSWLDKRLKYNKKALAAVKEMNRRIELEVFWNIQQNLKSSLFNWYHARLKDAEAMFQQHIDSIQNDYQDILGPIANVIAEVISAVGDIYFQQLTEMTELYEKNPTFAKKLLWFSFPDCELVLNNHEKEINKNIENEVNEHCKKFKLKCLQIFEDQQDKIVDQLQRQIDAEQKTVEQVALKLKDSKRERNRRMEEIRREIIKIDGFSVKLDRIREKFKRQVEEIPHVVFEPYQTLQVDIGKIVEGCRQIYNSSAEINY